MNTLIVILPCPSCDLDVALEVHYQRHAPVPASAHYPGDPAETEVWGEGSRCRCGHVIEVEDHTAEITAKVEEHEEAFA